MYIYIYIYTSSMYKARNRTAVNHVHDTEQFGTEQMFACRGTVWHRTGSWQGCDKERNTFIAIVRIPTTCAHGTALNTLPGTNSSWPGTERISWHGYVSIYIYIYIYIYIL